MPDIVVCTGMRNALFGTRVGNRFEKFGKLGKNSRGHWKLRNGNECPIHLYGIKKLLLEKKLAVGLKIVTPRLTLSCRGCILVRRMGHPVSGCVLAEQLPR
jgi:hypothetical protein